MTPARCEQMNNDGRGCSEFRGIRRYIAKSRQFGKWVICMCTRHANQLRERGFTVKEAGK